MNKPISMMNKPKNNKRRMNVFETETPMEEEKKQAKTKATAVGKTKTTKAPSETKESKTAAPSMQKMTETSAAEQEKEKKTKAPTVKTSAPKMPKAPKTPKSTIVPTIYSSETESSEGGQNAAEIPDTGSATSLTPPPSETPSQVSSESPSMIDMKTNPPTETEMKELTSDEPTMSPNTTDIQFDFSEGCKELAEGKIKQTDSSILVEYMYEITHDARRDLSDLLSVIEGDMEKHLGLSLLGCDTDETGNVIYDWRRHLMSEGGIVGVRSEPHEISTGACQVLAPADGNRCAVVDGKTRAYLTESGYGFVDGRAEEETLAAVRDFAMSGYNTSAYSDAGVEDLFYLGVPAETKSEGAGSSSAIKAEDGAGQSMSALGVGLIVASGLLFSGFIYWIVRKKKLQEPKVY